MKIKDTILLIANLFLLVFGAVALYPDQLGRSDWYIGNIGIPVLSTLHSKKSRMTLATAHNILTTLNLRNGEIIWRKQFSKEDIIQDIISSENYGFIITLSNNGKFIRCWDQIEGALKWELNLYSLSDTTNWAMLLESNLSSYLIVLNERSINVI